MRIDSARGSWLAALVAVVTLATGPWAGTAEAQYFGRNKVQYTNFDFEVLKTEHFDIHYYPEARATVEQAGRMAERWYARLSKLFGHDLSRRQIIILYANHPDFEQTTAISGQLDEGTGGVTEAFKQRVVLPMAGSLKETDHVLGHELVHAFQFDITTQTRSAVGGGFPVAVLMPLWFIEGMAEYMSLGPESSLTAMWMLDAARRQKLPTYRDLFNPYFFPYRYGQALWAYIGGRWGDPAIGEILKAAAATGDVTSALVGVLEISPDQLMADWKDAIQHEYDEVVAKTKSPQDYGRLLISSETGGGRYNVGPALSPDGKKVVFLSEKDRFSIEMFAADVATGKIERKIVKTAADPHFESIEFIYSAGEWSRDGQRFVLAGVSKGTPVLTILEAKNGKRIKEFKVKEVGEIFNPDFSPDGGSIVFTASVGGVLDLFTIDVESGALRRLTNDPYADMQPEWSPDGRKIAFVTDRFTSDLQDLSMGDYQIGLLDLEDGGIVPVPGFAKAKHINPQWSPDGTSIFYLSDYNGITNIYRVSLADGEIHQVTDLTTGVSGITELSPAISLAADARKLVFSAYEGNRYSLFVIDNDSVLEGGPVDPPISKVSPAVLPPADRPVGDVMALLENPDYGLPPSTADFESAPYKAGLSLDYIAPPQLAVGATGYGTFIGGGTSLFWSDILGEHNLATALQINGSFADVAALVSYENQRSRWNWGAAVAQLPFLTQGFAYTIDQANQTIEEQNLRMRTTSREISGLLSYPISRVQRVEFSGSFQNISYSNEIRTRTLSPTGVQLDQRTEKLPSCADVPPTVEPFCAPTALNLVGGSMAIVYDNTYFGFTGPVLGQRYRFEVSPTVGELNFISVTADYRRYFQPVHNVVLAGRILQFGRYLSGSQDPRLFPLYVGYQQVVRGYDPGSFSGRECVDPVDSKYFIGSANAGCPVYNQLFGTRMLVGNLELRVPFPQALGLNSLAGFPPFTLAVFFDAGSAWYDTRQAARVGGNKAPWDPVTSYGVASRINLFGAALIEVDFVHPNDRPQRGWYWQIGFSPGF